MATRANSLAPLVGAVTTGLVLFGMGCPGEDSPVNVGARDDTSPPADNEPTPEQQFARESDREWEREPTGPAGVTLEEWPDVKARLWCLEEEFTCDRVRFFEQSQGWVVELQLDWPSDGDARLLDRGKILASRASGILGVFGWSRRWLKELRVDSDHAFGSTGMRARISMERRRRRDSHSLPPALLGERAARVMWHRWTNDEAPPWSDVPLSTPWVDDRKPTP